jgi:hypothetical protein
MISPGEMEKTMYRRFIMGQNLRALFYVDRIPEALHRLIPAFQRCFGRTSNTSLDDVLAFDEQFTRIEEQAVTDNLTDLPESTYALLRQWLSRNDPAMVDRPVLNAVRVRTKVERLGEIFQTNSSSPVNSRVIYNQPATLGDPNQMWSAGEITTIFTHTQSQTTGPPKTKTFFVVDKYRPLSSNHALLDHYRAFPIIGGSLFYNAFKKRPELVCIDDVRCQFVYTQQDVPGIANATIHALPFDKVCCHIYYMYTQKTHVRSFSGLIWRIQYRTQVESVSLLFTLI